MDNNFAELLHKMMVGLGTTDHPAAQDYQELYADYIAGKDISEALVNEIIALHKWGDGAFAAELLKALVDDARAGWKISETVEAA
jgi:hypothetical protein